MSESVAQSVRARLLNIAHERREDYNLLLVRYGIERLLYRLTQTEYANRFVLKGATLFMLWMGQSHRPTQDLDLLGFGSIDDEELHRIFHNLCRIGVDDDGIIFDPASVRINEIREGEIYHGKRIGIRGYLGNARINVHVDIGFGDSIVPEPKKKVYPVLLDFPAPSIRIYPRETVVAEKLDAIIVLGLRNSRMKDYFDLWTLALNFDFDGGILKNAISATLERRSRALPISLPVGLLDEFAGDPTKQTQWKAFLNRSVPGKAEPELAVVVNTLRLFLGPVILAIGANISFSEQWQAANQAWIS